MAIGPSHARHARDCSPYGGSDAATLLCDKANSSFFNVPGEDAIRRLGVTQAKGQPLPRVCQPCSSMPILALYIAEMAGERQTMSYFLLPRISAAK